MVAPKGWPEGEVERDLDAWRRQAQRLRDTWAEARVEVDEIRDVKDRVLARIRYVTLGADTGIPFETPMAVVFFLSERKITRGYGMRLWEGSAGCRGLAGPGSLPVRCSC